MEGQRNADTGDHIRGEKQKTFFEQMAKIENKLVSKCPGNEVLWWRGISDWFSGRMRLGQVLAEIVRGVLAPASFEPTI